MMIKAPSSSLTPYTCDQGLLPDTRPIVVDQPLGLISRNLSLDLNINCGIAAAHIVTNGKSQANVATYRVGDICSYKFVATGMANIAANNMCISQNPRHQWRQYQCQISERMAR